MHRSWSDRINIGSFLDTLSCWTSPAALTFSMLSTRKNAIHSIGFLRFFFLLFKSIEILFIWYICLRPALRLVVRRFCLEHWFSPPSCHGTNQHLFADQPYTTCSIKMLCSVWQPIRKLFSKWRTIPNGQNKDDNRLKNPCNENRVGPNAIHGVIIPLNASSYSKGSNLGFQVHNFIFGSSWSNIR